MYGQVADELIAELGEPFAPGGSWSTKQAARAFTQVLQGLERHGQQAEVLHLALVQPPREVTVAQESLPAGLQGMEVATASAADFGALLRGGR